MTRPATPEAPHNPLARDVIRRVLGTLYLRPEIGDLQPFGWHDCPDEFLPRARDGPSSPDQLQHTSSGVFALCFKLFQPMWREELNQLLHVHAECAGRPSISSDTGA